MVSSLSPVERRIKKKNNYKDIGSHERKKNETNYQKMIPVRSNDIDMISPCVWNTHTGTATE